MGQHALLHPDDEDDRELQPLGGVEGDEGDGVDLLVVLVDVGHEGDVFQEADQRCRPAPARRTGRPRSAAPGRCPSGPRRRRSCRSSRNGGSRCAPGRARAGRTGELLGASAMSSFRRSRKAAGSGARASARRREGSGVAAASPAAGSGTPHDERRRRLLVGDELERGVGRDAQLARPAVQLVEGALADAARRHVDDAQPG